MASGSTERTEDLSGDIFFCKTCETKGIKNTSVEKYCVECNAGLCLTCVDFHVDQHTSIDLKTFSRKHNGRLPQEANRTVAMETKKTCDRHNLLLDMFCRDHDDVGCSLCMEVDHRFRFYNNL